MFRNTQGGEKDKGKPDGRGGETHPPSPSSSMETVSSQQQSWMTDLGAELDLAKTASDTRESNNNSVSVTPTPESADGKQERKLLPVMISDGSEKKRKGKKRQDASPAKIEDAEIEFGSSFQSSKHLWLEKDEVDGGELEQKARQRLWSKITDAIEKGWESTGLFESYEAFFEEVCKKPALEESKESNNSLHGIDLKDYKKPKDPSEIEFEAGWKLVLKAFETNMTAPSVAEIRKAYEASQKKKGLTGANDRHQSLAQACTYEEQRKGWDLTIEGIKKDSSEYGSNRTVKRLLEKARDQRQHCDRKVKEQGETHHG